PEIVATGERGLGGGGRGVPICRRQHHAHWLFVALPSRNGTDLEAFAYACGPCVSGPHLGEHFQLPGRKVFLEVASAAALPRQRVLRPGLAAFGHGSGGAAGHPATVRGQFNSPEPGKTSPTSSLFGDGSAPPLPYLHDRLYQS